MSHYIALGEFQLDAQIIRMHGTESQYNIYLQSINPRFHDRYTSDLMYIQLKEYYIPHVIPNVTRYDRLALGIRCQYTDKVAMRWNSLNTAFHADQPTYFFEIIDLLSLHHFGTTVGLPEIAINYKTMSTDVYVEETELVLYNKYRYNDYAFVNGNDMINNLNRTLNQLVMAYEHIWQYFFCQMREEFNTYFPYTGAASAAINTFLYLYTLAGARYQYWQNEFFLFLNKDPLTGPTEGKFSPIWLSSIPQSKTHMNKLGSYSFVIDALRWLVFDLSDSGQVTAVLYFYSNTHNNAGFCTRSRLPSINEFSLPVEYDGAGTVLGYAEYPDRNQYWVHPCEMEPFPNNGASPYNIFGNYLAGRGVFNSLPISIHLALTISTYTPFSRVPYIQRNLGINPPDPTTENLAALNIAQLTHLLNPDLANVPLASFTINNDANVIIDAAELVALEGITHPNVGALYATFDQSHVAGLHRSLLSTMSFRSEGIIPMSGNDVPALYGHETRIPMSMPINNLPYRYLVFRISTETNIWTPSGQKSNILAIVPPASLSSGGIPQYTMIPYNRIYYIKENARSMKNIQFTIEDDLGNPVPFIEPCEIYLALFFK